MVAETGLGRGGIGEVLGPDEFPVAVGGAVGAGEGFEAGAIEGDVGVGVVFGEEAIAEGDEGALAPRAFRELAGEFVDGALGVWDAVEAGGGAGEVVEAGGGGVIGGEVERLEVGIGFPVVVVGEQGGADVDLGHFASRTVELSEGVFEEALGGEGLAGVEEFFGAAKDLGGGGGGVAGEFFEAGQGLGGGGGVGGEGEVVEDGLVEAGGFGGLAEGIEGFGAKEGEGAGWDLSGVGVEDGEGFLGLMAVEVGAGEQEGGGADEGGGGALAPDGGEGLVGVVEAMVRELGAGEVVGGVIGEGGKEFADLLGVGGDVVPFRLAEGDGGEGEIGFAFGGRAGVGGGVVLECGGGCGGGFERVGLAEGGEGAGAGGDDAGGFGRDDAGGAAGTGGFSSGFGGRPVGVRFFVVGFFVVSGRGGGSRRRAGEPGESGEAKPEDRDKPSQEATHHHRQGYAVTPGVSSRAAAGKHEETGCGRLPWRRRFGFAGNGRGLFGCVRIRRVVRDRGEWWRRGRGRCAGL